MIGYEIYQNSQSQKRTVTNLGLFLLLEGPSYEVNNKSCLSLDEEKNHAVLALISAEYEVNKMVKGYYQTVLQSMLLLCLAFDLFFSFMPQSYGVDRYNILYLIEILFYRIQLSQCQFAWIYSPYIKILYGSNAHSSFNNSRSNTHTYLNIFRSNVHTQLNISYFLASNCLT